MDEIAKFSLGVVIGVLLSVPVSVFLLIAVTHPPREDNRPESYAEVRHVEGEIVVINPRVPGYLGEGE